jgi:amino acid transporter
MIFQIIGKFMFIIALICSCAIPLLIIVDSCRNFWRGKEDYLKGFFSLFIWVFVSLVMFSFLFATLFSAAHAANPENVNMKLALWLTFLSVVYILIGVGLMFFVNHMQKPKIKT